MSFLTAPLYSLFSPSFYRTVIHSRLRQGFLYLAFLCALMYAVVFFSFFTRIMPQVDGFFDWLAEEMPEMTWTPEGLVMNARSPYVVVHPGLGPIAEINTSVQEIDPQQVSDVWAYITSTRAYIRDGEGRFRVYDLTQSAEDLPPERLVMQIDDAFILDSYRSLRPWFIALILLLFFPLLYLWKLGEVFFFSLIGILMNLGRRPALDYQAIIRISFFAITAATLLQFRSFIFPPLAMIPFGIPGTILVTVAYLFLGIRKTQEEPGTAQES